MSSSPEKMLPEPPPVESQIELMESPFLEHIYPEITPISCFSIGVTQLCYQEETELAETTFTLLESAIRELWVSLLSKLPTQPSEHWIYSLSEQCAVSVILVSNTDIQVINQTYRNKGEATDVLSFPTIENADNNEENISQMKGLKLPMLELGDIYISLPWAKQQIQQNALNNTDFDHHYARFVCDRFLHGCLHLLGFHHDTMPAYEFVRATQDAVLDEVLG